MDKNPSSSRACLSCSCDEEHHVIASDVEDDPPNSCEETVDEIQEQHLDHDSGNNGNLPQTAVESNNAESVPEAATIASNSSPSRPNRDALNGIFSSDLLNVLNACTRMHYQHNGHTSQMNEFTFANAMNSYLDAGGDMNMANIYESARVVSNGSYYIEDYNLARRYPVYLRRQKETRDACVMTDPFVIAEESEDDDSTIEGNDSTDYKENGDPKDAEHN